MAASRTVALQGVGEGHVRRSREQAEAVVVRLALSADYRHVLVARQEQRSGMIRFHWRLVSIDSGKIVDVPDRPYTAVSFVVVGRVLVASRGIVEGVSRSGKSLWTVSVRPTRYMGPYPP